jgi:hypothetical protein
MKPKFAPRTNGVITESLIAMVIFLWMTLVSTFIVAISNAQEEEVNLDYVDAHTHEFQPTLQDLRASALDQARFQQQQSNRAVSFPLIFQDVMFTVIYKADGTGKVTYSSLIAQINELNRDFSGADATSGGYAKATDSRIRFRFGAVRYLQNDDIHSYCSSPDAQKVFRPKYALDPSRYLNIYICSCPANLGLSWLPYQAYEGIIPSESHWILGVTLHWELLPGNSVLQGRFSQGKICTHETGHTMGLRHLYDGGCDQPDEYTDQVDDTPRQQGNPSADCHTLQGRDSCPNKPGLDDNSNYMGIAYDSCRNHFTPGQVVFMQNTILARKPTLIRQLPPFCVASVDSTDNSPDLAPCLNNVVYVDETSRKWCRTDPDYTQVWAWACCPSDDPVLWGKEDCRLGEPNFSTRWPLLSQPFGGPTDSPTQTTSSPTKKPTQQPTEVQATSTPTITPTIANTLDSKPGPNVGGSCEWIIVEGGPVNENTKCQLPFTISGKSYSSPVTVQVMRPYNWYSFRSLDENTLWCPTEGLREYHRSSESKRSLWGPASCLMR